MSKKAPKKQADLSKKVFDLNSFKRSLVPNSSNREKELTWIPLSEAFTEAVKLPGVPRGFVSLFRGYSNTGKSTAIYEAVKGCQEIGDLAVVIETEGNWSWEHAKNIGIKFEEVANEETGEIDYSAPGLMLFRGRDLLTMYGNYDYSKSTTSSKVLRTEPVIEDVARIMDELLEAQANDDLPYNITFLWDSIGTLNCFKSVISKSANNQWNAGAMESSFKAMLNFKIPSSRALDSKYTNTFMAVQKIWLDNENKVIKHKGGEAAFYGARLIFHYGGILTHSTAKLKATSLGNEYQFGIETRISCEKNQVTGIEEKGKICSTPHGYVSPEKLDQYKKDNVNFIREKLNVNFGDEIVFVTEEVEEINESN